MRVDWCWQLVLCSASPLAPCFAALALIAETANLEVHKFPLQLRKEGELTRLSSQLCGFAAEENK